MNGLFLATSIIGTGLVVYAARNFFRQIGDGELIGEPIHEMIEKKTLAEVSRTWNREA
jgi:hypothetical protein